VLIAERETLRLKFNVKLKNYRREGGCMFMGMDKDRVWIP